MAGRQTVRARTKNVYFPNGNLAGRGICLGVSGWTLVNPHFSRNNASSVEQVIEAVHTKKGGRLLPMRGTVNAWTTSRQNNVNRNAATAQKTTRTMAVMRRMRACLFLSTEVSQ